MRKFIITEEEKKHILNLYEIANPNDFVTVKEINPSTIPLGRNVSDGLVEINYPNNYKVSLMVNGKDINTILKGDGNVTGVTKHEYKNGYNIFFSANTTNTIDVTVTDPKTNKTQKINLPANIGSSKTVIGYTITPVSGNKEYKITQYQLPQDLKPPKNIGEQSLVVIDSPVNIGIDYSNENLVKNENLFTVGKRTFIYVDSGPGSFDINLNPQLINLGFNTMMKSELKGSLNIENPMESGKTYYFNIE